MSRKRLKKLLVDNPNEFWEVVKIEGLSARIIAVLDEGDAEMDGVNIS